MKIKEIYTENKAKLTLLFGRSIFHDVVSIFLLSSSLLLLLALFLILTFRIKPGDYLIPLVYNSTYGVTSLGKWYKIYLYPISFAGLTLINFLVAWAYFEKERLITYLTLFVNLIIGALLLIAEYNLTVIIKG